jgi:predicted DNA-binding transcriptional regulator AlpA
MKLPSLPAATTKLGISASTLRRMIDRGEFINAIQVSSNVSAQFQAPIGPG